MEDTRRPDHHPASDAAGRLLREALEPPPVAVERVVRRALAAETRAEARRGSPRLDRRRSLLAALAPALLAALLLGAGLWLGSGRPGTGPGDPPQEAAAVLITNVGDIVVARSGERTRIVRSSASGAAPPAGKILIRYGGGE